MNKQTRVQGPNKRSMKGKCSWDILAVKREEMNIDIGHYDDKIFTLLIFITHTGEQGLLDWLVYSQTFDKYLKLFYQLWKTICIQPNLLLNYSTKSV